MNSKLKELIKKYALEIKKYDESFTLKNGSKTNYYFDCRNLNLTPTGLNCVVNEFMTRLSKLSKTTNYTAIGGPTIGADPIIGGLIYCIAFGGVNNIRGFLVRKEDKSYGKKGRIVGPLKPTDNCVIIEDVVSSGNSVMDSIKAVKDFGCNVVQVYSIIDRLMGAAELFDSNGIPFESLFTIKDFELESNLA